MADEPSSDLPWVLRQKGLKLIDMRIDEEGHTHLFFRSPYGPIRQVDVTMLTDQPVTWVYGYVIRDRHSKTKVTYSGPYGDPVQDEAIDVQGV
jgi:hypothetical protein